jgi:hypothetical protein
MGIALQTGSFEAERSPAEPVVEEVRDFEFLIEEIREASREDAQARLGSWMERFDRGWTNDSEQWSMLVDLLPRARDVEPSVEQFRKLLLSTTREPSGADAFFANPAIASKLSSYAWTDFLGQHASGLVAGCLNVARAAAQTGSPSSTLMGILSTTVANYPLTLIGLALHDPALVTPTPDGCSLADALDVARERFGRWNFDQSVHEVRQILATFDAETLVQALRSLHGQEELSEAVLAPFVKIALDADDEKAAARLGELAFESPATSSTLAERYRRATGEARAATLALWARYLALDDAFAFCWECVRPGTTDAPSPLGDGIDARLAQLEKLLTIKSSLGPKATFGDRAEWTWREPALRAMAAAGALVGGKWTAREDQVICENDVVAALSSCPDFFGRAVSGLLDSAHEFREVLDPVILKLPKDKIVPALTEYADRASVWSEARHRAARLLTHAKGEAILGERGEAVPTAAEQLPEPVRERRPIASQTWLGEGTQERLWGVALDVAMSRFDECMASRYADDKEEHCAALADVVARALNGTNSALKMWLRSNGATPMIRATVRRAAAKGKRVGAGLQPDLGILVKCNLAGKCVTKRITPFRAKKLGTSSGPFPWATDFKIPSSERTSLTRLLTMSSATHYLFVLPRETGDSLRVMPAALVRDMVASQGFAGGIPVRTVMQAGMRMPEFLLFNVLGLWTGDDDADLIAKAEPDSDQEGGPSVVLEITLSKDAGKE